MKKSILFSFLCLLFIVSILPSSAQKIGHITLLAVSEATQMGQTADLYLRIQEGSGGVYIDTFPLTKLDTQLSTRFAQQIACDFLERDCRDVDFFYTVRSDAAIIGGPSAGAALATVTVAMLEDLKVDETVALTGTINVGGLIGPVGSLVGKIDAAKENNMTKVLIPKGSRYEEKPAHSYNELLMNKTAPFYQKNNETNATEIDLYEYGKFIGIEVKEVGTLQEAVYEITGKWYERDETEIIPEEWYVTTMSTIAEQLCKRTEALTEMIKTNTTDWNVSNQEMYEGIIESTIRAENATAYDKNYVAASTCFGTNIRLQYLLISTQNLTKNQTIDEVNQLNMTITMLQGNIDERELRTITDLQTYLVVNERIEEAEETVKELTINIAIDLLEDTPYQIAYANERLFSAEAWAQFFENDGKELDLNEEAIKQSCIQKRAEAEERYQYVHLITDETMENVEQYLTTAEQNYKEGNYVLCLDIASRAKANLDIVLSLVGVRTEEQLKEIVEERLKLIRQVLNEQQKKGYFPMLGYSYYEYASYLKEEDPYSALIYSHYALEFSNLDMYFEEKEKKIDLLPERQNILYLILGFGMGIVFATGTLLWIENKERKKHH